MKAKEFIQAHGWGEAKLILKEQCNYAVVFQSPTHFDSKSDMFVHKDDSSMINESCVCLIELQKYVTAWELVRSYNGLGMAKKFLDENVPCSDSSVLQKAIQLVESVNESN